ILSLGLLVRLVRPILSLGLLVRLVKALDAAPLKPDNASLAASEGMELDEAGGLWAVDGAHNTFHPLAQPEHLSVAAKKTAPQPDDAVINLASDDDVEAGGKGGPPEASAQCSPRDERPGSQVAAKEPGIPKKESPPKQEQACGGESTERVAGAVAAKKNTAKGRRRGRGAEENKLGESGAAQRRRKGDSQMDAELAMALQATAAASQAQAPATGAAAASQGTSAPKDSDRAGRGSAESAGGASGWSKRITAESVRHWMEVYINDEAGGGGRWVHVDPVRQLLDQAEGVELLVGRRNPMAYVMAFAGGGAKDVTRRYAKWSSAVQLRVSDGWLEDTLRPLLAREATAGAQVVDGAHAATSPLPAEARDSSAAAAALPHAQGAEASAAHRPAEGARAGGAARGEERNAAEDVELETRALTEKLPKTLGALKNHPLYVVEKHLAKNQMLRPRGPVLGFVQGFPAFPRSCVQTLLAASGWKKKGRQICAEELGTPAKTAEEAKARQRRASARATAAAEEEEEAREAPGAAGVAMYGDWQTEPIVRPVAQNGRVPRNQYNNVEVFTESLLPIGTVHLRYPRIGQVAAQLQIDAAPAVTGFEQRAGRSYPVIEGIVVCKEFADTLVAVYFEEERRREHERLQKKRAEAIHRWRQINRTVWARRQLREEYGVDEQAAARPSPGCDSKAGRSLEVTESEEVSGASGLERGGAQRGARGLAALKQPGAASGPHTHQFPLELQEYDEESGLTRKRCLCGYVLEVEEI
ncbi:hypothetical protein CYMTET_42373, partial [Cymbomonas tetramitiformis]